LVQAPDRPFVIPSAEVLSLHDSGNCYRSLEQFQPQLSDLLEKGALLGEVLKVTATLGFLEPFTGVHISPGDIQIQGTNYRESLIANGLLSRNRAVLRVLERTFGSIKELRSQDVYLVEALTGFALWLRRHLGDERLICSEFLEEAEQRHSDIPHQDLCNLSFADASFDLVLCNELFEHLQDMDIAFREVARVLRPGGRLVGTCPMAFGQQEAIVKAVHDPETGMSELLGDAELHGDPVRPETGSLVYRIPGWDVVGQLQAAGFREAVIHHEAAWKHGVLGSDLPGVLVIDAVR
jgi:SAM-dependent methyltransferase